MAHPKNTPEKFWLKVKKTGTCWLWQGAPHVGYGRFRYEGRCWQAHVLSYTWANGPVPDGLVLDHVVARGCGNKMCVRPDHLEPVTDQENFRRGRHPKREQTHCIHGHIFDAANTYIKKNGMRMCRQCRVDANRRSKQRKRERNVR